MAKITLMYPPPPLSSDAVAVLIEIAGFLTLIHDGHIAVPDHARREAGALLKKIGDVLP